MFDYILNTNKPLCVCSFYFLHNRKISTDFLLFNFLMYSLLLLNRWSKIDKMGYIFNLSFCNNFFISFP